MYGDDISCVYSDDNSSNIFENPLCVSRRPILRNWMILLPSRHTPRICVIRLLLRVLRISVFLCLSTRKTLSTKIRIRAEGWVLDTEAVILKEMFSASPVLTPMHNLKWYLWSMKFEGEGLPSVSLWRKLRM